MIVIFLSVLLFSSPVFAQSIRIGSVSIVKDKEKLTVFNGVKKYQFDSSDISQQVFVMTTPFAEVSGMDGSVEAKQSKGIVDLPSDTRMTAQSIPSFMFIGPEKKYIGFLSNTFGASGGSFQKRVIFDTSAQGVYEIDSGDMASPGWLRRGKNLIGFVEYNLDLYLGDHATSLGYSPRISNCYVFKKSAAATVDNAVCKDVSTRRYAAVKFSKDELRLLAQKGVLDLPRELGVKLLDKVYYGLKAGKRSEVEEFVKKLHSEFRDELRSVIKRTRSF